MTLIQSLADERHTLQKEYETDSREITRLIKRRLDTWIRLQAVEKELRVEASRQEP